MQRKTIAVQLRCKLTISHAGAKRNRVRLLIDRHLSKVFKRNLVLRAVGYTVEGMPCAECLQLVTTLDNFLDLFNGLGNVQLIGTVLVIACPILSRLALLLISDQAREHATGN